MNVVSDAARPLRISVPYGIFEFPNLLRLIEKLPLLIYIAHAARNSSSLCRCSARRSGVLKGGTL
jgi:hypothetical protein